MARMSAARVRNHRVLQEEIEWELAHDKTLFSYLEPWQRLAVDPTIEHVVTLEIYDEAFLANRRVTCSCGLDRGWQAPISAIQDARWHREHVMRAKRDAHLDQLPIALIERKRMSAGSLFRWCCDACGGAGTWLASEPIAGIGSILHAQECEAPATNAAKAARQPRRS